MEKTIIEGKTALAWLICRLFIDFFAMCILIGFWWICRDIVRYTKTKITVTDRRVHGHTGLVNTEDLDSPLGKITGVKVEQDAFGKMFNYGTIIITTASNAFAFGAIRNPAHFSSTLNSQIEQSEEEKEDRLARKIAKANQS